MLIPLDNLATPLAQVANRLNIVGPYNSADTFLTASYLSEAAVKIFASTLHSALSLHHAQHAYKLAYDLVRADGLGVWTSSIEKATSMPLSSFLPPDFSPLLEWATRRRTKPEDEWCREALACTNEILGELGVEIEQTRRESVRNLLNGLVQIRNKTKAHGALGPDFFSFANEPYIRAVSLLVENCPLFKWRWIHLSMREKGPARGVLLQGISPRYMKDSEVANLRFAADGLYFQAAMEGKLFFCGQLFSSTQECQIFTLPNGGYNGATGEPEYIDYATGHLYKRDASNFLAAPVPLPPSETEGLSAIDVQSNLFGNLPGLPKDYVSRKDLEIELKEKLIDQNHEIISLHGRGGMGKTYLALSVAHDLSTSTDQRFENIVWFSARDLDLRMSGPRAVKADVVTIADVYKKYATLFDVPSDLEYFALLLQGSGDRKKPGTLFIFDNFETMQDLTELHRFLDHHTTSPNKVLLTTRERAFKADYPIEVKGMEHSEALLMIRNLVSDLRVEALVSDEVIESIYDFTKGHPYVIKVVLGEMAKEHRYVAPAQVLSSRVDTQPGTFQFVAIQRCKSN
jgi:NB-ARC domain